MTLNLDLRRIESDDKVLYISFNQSNECFSVGTDKGFRIYNCEPFEERYRRGFSDGGIGIVEMLFRTNMLVLVGGGEKPCWPPSRVEIWDDVQMKSLDSLQFAGELVKAVKLRREKVFVSTAEKVYVYGFTTVPLKMLHKYDTMTNRLGIFAVSPSSSRCVQICLSRHAGVVRVEEYKGEGPKETSEGGFVNAHESQVAMMALNSDGTLMATASEKGTLLRVFSTVSRSLVRELRRGTQEAEILSLCFSPDAKLTEDKKQATGKLACSSSNNTIHVFGLGEAENKTSSLSALSLVSSYFSSEWSLAQYSIPCGVDCRSVCVFGPRDTLYLATSDGQFRTLRVPEDGGEITAVSQWKFPTPQLS